MLVPVQLTVLCLVLCLKKEMEVKSSASLQSLAPIAQNHHTRIASDRQANINSKQTRAIQVPLEESYLEKMCFEPASASGLELPEPIVLSVPELARPLKL